MILSAEGPKLLREYLNPLVDALDKRYNGEDVHGITTGNPELDTLTGGLAPGDLWIVAARPSMGKTVFGLNVSRANSIDSHLTSLFFSLEMTAEKICRRYMSAIANVSGGAIRDGKLRDEDWPRITNAMAVMKEARVYIDETAGLSITQLCRRAKAMKHKGLGLIVVDYLQLLSDPEKKNRHEEVANISRQLKQLAKQVNAPVIALSQLNRELEKRGNKRPMMSDIRESGQIEQDADVIIGLYREEVYDKETIDKGVVEYICLKNRDGETGTVRASAEMAFSRFGTLEYSPTPMSQTPSAKKAKEYYRNE
jgi:replicative DNA helicase